MSLRPFASSHAAGALLKGATAASLLLAAGGGAVAVASRTEAPEPPRCLHSTEDLSRAFEYVADTLGPSVVSITTANRLEARAPQGFAPFFQFPGQPNPRANPFGQPRQPSPESYVQRGQGSGLIVSEDGYVLTNNHVVKDADEVNVILWDDSSYVAEIVGTDP